MKHYFPSAPQTLDTRITIPPFHAVPLRVRTDGWTPLRQAEFIGHLAATRSVAEAARNVSMARETAYRLRTKPGAQGFAAAWDVALACMASHAGKARLLAALEAACEAMKPSRKVTVEQLTWRVETGLWQVRLRAGRYAGVRRKADNSALFALLARTGRGDAGDAV
ncbi:hypothetical protein [Qipengyuania qiaonensis]|uniref:Helix-turn-helix domain-containing protein n=1 Tax=Qipengyuania qiaonensis TaxID=2867240 RepID=A0ABS7J868_9SPHN|nr:hypothetical protein [Qipengyuania qiaonensis]MBX7483123.1 hypothetical protein [Qipengyuania qiaonensis]